MKIQCSCGAKVAFDVTPDMAQRRVQFVCPSCGVDASDFVNDLIRQELARTMPSQPVVAIKVAAPLPTPARPATLVAHPVRVAVPTAQPIPTATPSETTDTP